MTKRYSSTGTASPIQQAMSTLTAQWYNAVTQQCTLSPQTFQLFQGNTSLGETSESMWSTVDVVPPQSVNNYYNPSQLNIFSQQYGSVITQLNPAFGGNFEQDMEDSYDKWEAYLKKQTWTTTQQYLQLFQNWYMVNMDPTQGEKCYTDLETQFNGPIGSAVNVWNTVAQKVKAFNGTIEQVTTELLQKPSRSVNMDSTQQSSDVSHTWADGEVFGDFDFFDEAGGESNFDQITTQMAQAGITIQANFDHLLTFPLQPLYERSDDPNLKQYLPWYNSAALGMAYKQKSVWNDPSNWESFFGTTGMLLRTCSALVLVDGIHITITSDASLSQTQQTQVQSAMEAGIWPFFAVSASGGWTNNASFNAQGSVTITQTCPSNPSDPNVLGAIVTPIADSFS